MTTLEQAELMREQRVILVAHRQDVSLKVAGALGEAEMNASIYGPILDELGDHKPKTLAQLETTLKAKNISIGQIMEATMILSGAGHVLPVQDDAVANKARKHTDKINQHILKKARGSGDIGYIASPVTGGGILLSRFYQLFLLAMASGKKQPAEWAQYAWNLLASQNQKILKEGKALESPEDNLAELTAQANTFSTKTLPVLKPLQIV